MGFTKVTGQSKEAFLSRDSPTPIRVRASFQGSSGKSLLLSLWRDRKEEQEDLQKTELALRSAVPAKVGREGVGVAMQCAAEGWV